MDNRYLWDRTGEPDPEIQRLEQMLGEFRHRPRRVNRWPAAIAAAALIAFSSWLFRAPQTGWQFERLSAKGDVLQHSLLPTGGTLETDSVSRAQLQIADIGTLQLDPDTHVKLISSKTNNYRVVLDHGTIHALITAPPRNFFVDSPGGVAVDLGCKYTMQVDRTTGNGRLEVELGWVAFEAQGRESFIPAGAACSTSRDKGPGIPVMLSSPAFRGAVAQYEANGTLQDLLATASHDDVFSLWHVLQRVPEYERKAVYKQMAALSPVPPQVTEEGVLQLDRKMLDAWWDSFGLNDASFWREHDRNT